MFRIGAASLVLVLAGCAGSEDAPVLGERHAIIDGEISPAGPEDAVLLLRSSTPESGERLCGASLVAENLVVTARHCVAYINDGAFQCTLRGEIVEGTPGAGRMGVDLDPTGLEFYTRDERTEPVAFGQSIVSTLSLSACSNDLAFVVLDRALELPVFALRRDRPALTGEAVVAIGYGADQNIEQELDLEAQERRRREDQTVALVGPDTDDELGAVAPRIVIVEGPGACIGDSGGPLLSRETNALIAVHSLVQGDCVSAETRNWYTHLPPLWTWAERAFEAAGATPLIEPLPPGNDDCVDGGGCAGMGGVGGTSGASGAPGTAGMAGDGGEPASGGTAGAPPDPTEPDDSPARKTKRGGCAFVSAHKPEWPAANAALLCGLVVLFRRLRASRVTRSAR